MDYAPPASGPGDGRAAAGGSDSPPSKLEIDAAVDRVIASPSLASSPRLQALLRHVVGATLDGQTDRLKEYSIGVDVFDRPETFDPRIDSIVRVQASRLRKQMDVYYRKAGAADPVRIAVPAGGYAATFSRVTPQVKALGSNGTPPVGRLEPVKAGPTVLDAEPEPALEPLARAGRPGGGALAMGGGGQVVGIPVRSILVFGMLAVTTLVLIGLVVLALATRDAGQREILDPKGPTVFVSRYDLIEGPGPGRQLRDGLQYELIDRLSRFPELSILGIDTVFGAEAAAARRDPRGADFILMGSVQSNATTLSVNNQLVRTSDSTVVWSRSYSSELSDAYNLLDVQSGIAADVASQLGQPYGVIQEKLDLSHSHLRQLSLQDYLCVLDSYHYARAKTQESHLRVRNCLEEVTRRTPDYAPAWAKLSWMYGDEARFGFNRRVNDAPPFERAKRAAENAVAADPNTAIGHQYLSIALFALGDDTGASKSGDMALRLNPNNSEILADHGQQLILIDGSTRGKEMIEKAIALNPGYPPWYAGGLAVYYLNRGEAELAMRYALRFAADGSPMASYILAAAHRLGGDGEAADQVLAELEARSPGAVSNRAERMRSLRMARSVEPLIFGE